MGRGILLWLLGGAVVSALLLSTAASSVASGVARAGPFSHSNR
jgi:hypothetical protein